MEILVYISHGSGTLWRIETKVTTAEEWISVALDWQLETRAAEEEGTSVVKAVFAVT